MAYAFNDNKTKVTVLPASYFDQQTLKNNFKPSGYSWVSFYAVQRGDIVYVNIDIDYDAAEDAGYGGGADVTIAKSVHGLPLFSSVIPSIYAPSWPTSTFDLGTATLTMDASGNIRLVFGLFRNEHIKFSFSYPINPTQS